jgi:hypothetical protein
VKLYGEKVVKEPFGNEERVGIVLCRTLHPPIVDRGTIVVTSVLQDKKWQSGSHRFLEQEKQENN